VRCRKRLSGGFAVGWGDGRAVEVWALLDRRAMAEVIGWFSSVVLLMTIGKQVHKQWREGASQGVSKWLFIRPDDGLGRVSLVQLARR
jgi:hypothetical protein